MAEWFRWEPRQTESTDHGLALWGVPHAHDAASMEAHFNYWRVAEADPIRRLFSKRRDDYLEVGVLLTDPGAVDRVCLYVPRAVAADAVTDCGTAFRTQPDIAQGIFNERLATSTAPHEHRGVDLTLDQRPFCRVYEFLADRARIEPDELTLEAFARGTLVTITRQAIAAASIPGTAGQVPERVYFRLRIRMRPDAANPLVNTVATPDQVLQSGFTEIEYIDFRLNEVRTLPAKVETRMRAEQGGPGVPFSLVAFLTAVPVRSELSANNMTVHKLRLLEHRLWDGYVPDGIPRGMMVYHWKRTDATGPITDFSAFVKLQTRRSGLWTSAKYLGVAFAFGILGNCAASRLDGWWSARRSATPPGASVRASAGTRRDTQPPATPRVVAPSAPSPNGGAARLR